MTIIEPLKSEGQNKEYLLTNLDGLPTILPGQVERTAAIEIVAQIHAGRSRRAGTGPAVVDVLLAVDPGVALGADALVALAALVDTGGTVLAGARRACVVLVLAAHARVVGGAGAV